MAEPIRYAIRGPRPITGERSPGEQDLRFILDAWVKSFGDSRNPFESQCGYRQAQRHVIASVLERSKVFLACGAGDEVKGKIRDEDFIYGFAVGEPRGSFAVAHYVYVKEDFRRRGVGTQLLKAIRKGCGVNLTITSVTQPWIREKATANKWRVAEMANLYQLINERQSA